MGLFTTGSVVLVRFPFSDLTQSKLRPAIVLAWSSAADWVLCQVTINTFSDKTSIKIEIDDFHTGALKVTSFARPSKLFTASESPIATTVGTLELDKFDKILDAVIGVFEGSRQP